MYVDHRSYLKRFRNKVLNGFDRQNGGDLGGGGLFLMGVAEH
jgi:hypothetical protein